MREGQENQAIHVTCEQQFNKYGVMYKSAHVFAKVVASLAPRLWDGCSAFEKKTLIDDLSELGCKVLQRHSVMHNPRQLCCIFAINGTNKASSPVTILEQWMSRS